LGAGYPEPLSELHRTGKECCAIFDSKLTPPKHDSAHAESPGEGQDVAFPPPPLAGLRVLAVEDDCDTLEVMVELLSMRGAEVVPAASAAEALEALQRFDPDVLVSDIGMPERDGYDLIRDIRGLGRGPEDLPAVAVTAFTSPEDRRRALAAGFQVHLAKPVDPSELTAVVARLGRGGAAG
jgi:CheY-like chemotaxis protein